MNLAAVDFFAKQISNFRVYPFTKRVDLYFKTKNLLDVTAPRSRVSFVLEKFKDYSLISENVKVASTDTTHFEILNGECLSKDNAIRALLKRQD